ncbi:two-component sensor histidine kinase DegS [Selenomonas sp. TAMA-11512]|uniref:sensor histidine kinase n=1 Tax=Selenomonas sp. TAMA-11512 TaxID=3095337 RepID=UPI00308A5D34|nr:two-component sensor histidine kinase DegS [Selenomonas sp. TAMA-11512]
MAGKRAKKQALENLKKEDLMEKLSTKSLDGILKNTVNTIETNKTQVVDIYEKAREEVDDSRKKLVQIRQETMQTIAVVDDLAKREQLEKKELARVSADFRNYSEERIRMHYEVVTGIQIELNVAREKETQLRAQRDALELRLRGLKDILRTAEHMAIAIGSVLGYLSSEINGVVWQIEEAQKSKFIGAQVIKAQEEERFRVSRELHDGPAQDIANLIFQSSIIERMIDKDAEEAKRGLQELREMVRGCLGDIRQIIFDMRPMSLDDLGLTPALSQLVSKMRDRGMVDASFTVDGDERKFSKYVEVSVFRIVQEALNNVAHHSGTLKAEVRVLFSATAMALTVTDKGNGFDPDKPMPKKTATEDFEEDRDVNDPKQRHLEGGYGLLGMKERAAIIGAELKITSKPGEGTRVHLRLPYRDNIMAAQG